MQGYVTLCSGFLVCFKDLCYEFIVVVIYIKIVFENLTCVCKKFDVL